MEYLFKAPVVLVARTTWYDVHLQEDGAYFCKQTHYHNSQTYDKGPGDVTLRKEGKKWKAENAAGYIDADLVQRLGEHIDDYNRTADKS